MTSVVKKTASKGGLIAELKETCKELETWIRVAKARKEALEALIESLEQADRDNVGQAKETEAQTSSERSNLKMKQVAVLVLKLMKMQAPLTSFVEVAPPLF
jgi:cell division FtsZ-interacting protein ZapD